MGNQIGSLTTTEQLTRLIFIPANSLLWRESGDSKIKNIGENFISPSIQQFRVFYRHLRDSCLRCPSVLIIAWESAQLIETNTLSPHTYGGEFVCWMILD